MMEQEEILCIRDNALRRLRKGKAVTRINTATLIALCELLLDDSPRPDRVESLS